MEQCPTSTAAEPQTTSPRLSVTSTVQSIFTTNSDKYNEQKSQHSQSSPVSLLTSVIWSIHTSDRPLERMSPDNRGSTVPLVITMNTNQGGSLSSNRTECYDGSVSGILGALLVATMFGWIVTCVAYRKRSTTLKRRKFLK